MPCELAIPRQEAIFDVDPLEISGSLAERLQGCETFALLRADEPAFRAECGTRGIAVKDVIEAARGERCAVLARSATSASWVVAASQQRWPTVSAWAVTSLPALDRQTAERGSLQLAFGRHLSQTRNTTAGTAQQPPILLDGEPDLDGTHLIAFPHLVVVADAMWVTDRILWEAMEPAVLERLVGRASFDLEYWRKRLGSLITLKAALREGSVRAATSPAMRSLCRALTDRYLSFRFVLQHEDLLREVTEGRLAEGRRIGRRRSV